MSDSIIRLGDSFKLLRSSTLMVAIEVSSTNMVRFKEFMSDFNLPCVIILVQKLLVSTLPECICKHILQVLPVYLILALEVLIRRHEHLKVLKIDVLHLEVNKNVVHKVLFADVLVVSIFDKQHIQ